MLSYSYSSYKTDKSEDVILTIQYKDNPILKYRHNGHPIYDGYLMFYFLHIAICSLYFENILANYGAYTK